MFTQDELKAIREVLFTVQIPGGAAKFMSELQEKVNGLIEPEVKDEKKESRKDN